MNAQSNGLASRRLPLALGVLCLLSAGAFASRAAGWPERVEARSVAPAPERPAPAPRVRAEGRITSLPGAEVVLSAEIMASVASMRVVEGSTVEKGDLLVELDAEDRRAAVAEAEALVVERAAEARFAASEVVRAERSRRENVISEQQLDAAHRDRDCADARVSLAGAGLSRARTALAKTRITAPISGTVIERRAHEGETVAPGQRLLVIADLSRIRVEAEVDEFDIGRLAVGAAAVVEAEGDLPGPAVRGRIVEIPDAVLPRRLAPQDPGRPTDTRVALVKVALEGKAPWKLGQRVELVIEGTR